ncbi:MAG TPA: class GN sortase [Usitatibacter sp.]|nr:class GN sortase [Usitatibacter sp.]
MKKRAFLAAAALFACFGTWQVASAAWIHAKGRLAQELLAISWQRGQLRDQAPPPWPGADLRPMARLIVPSRGVSLFVLDAAHGRALAFGPALLPGTAAPGADGNSVLVAHRDTHFAFVRRLEVNDEIDVETPQGSRKRYRVREMRIVDKHDLAVAQPTGHAQLTLVTCYPFDALRPGTPLRYVVVADRTT